MSILLATRLIAVGLLVLARHAAAQAGSAAERDVYDACPALHDFDRAYQAEIEPRGLDRFHTLVDALTDGRFVVRMEIVNSSGNPVLYEETGTDCADLLAHALARVRRIPRPGEGPADRDDAVAFLASGLVDIGSAPIVAGGARLGLMFGFGVVSLLLELDVLFPAAGSLPAPGGSFGTALLAGGALGCLRPPRAGILHFDFCAGLQAGAVKALPQNVVALSSGEALYLDLDAGMIASARLLPWASVLLTGDFLVPLVVPRFALAGVSEPVATSTVVGGRFGAGVSLSF